MRIIVCFLLFLFTLLSGCKDDSIAAKLLSKCGKADSCTKLVRDVTDFKWDKVYVFSVGASLEDIDRILGFHYSEWEDVGDRILFVSDNKVVYHEDYFPYPDVKKGSTFFDLTSAPYIGKYDNATFSVKKVQNSNDKYYYVIRPEK